MVRTLPRSQPHTSPLHHDKPSDKCTATNHTTPTPPDITPTHLEMSFSSASRSAWPCSTTHFLWCQVE